MNTKLCDTTVHSIGERKMAFTISTAAIDRDGDTIDPQGWDTRAYERNSVVLWAHNHQQPPVAKATRLWTDRRGLHAEVEFPPEGVYPFADQVQGLTKAGFINATSVGFRPLKMTPTKTGQHITKAELLEFSLVSIPSNQEALVLQRSAKCNTKALERWLGRSEEKQEIDWGRINDELENRVEVDVSTADVVRVIDLVVPPLVSAALGVVVSEAANRAFCRLTGRLD